MCRAVLRGVFFRPQWLCDESLWPSRHLPLLQLGQTNELYPYTVIIRLMTVFRCKMTKINEEKARWRGKWSQSMTKGRLDTVERHGAKVRDQPAEDTEPGSQINIKHDRGVKGRRYSVGLLLMPYGNYTDWMQVANIVERHMLTKVRAVLVWPGHFPKDSLTPGMNCKKGRDQSGIEWN